MSMHFKIVCKCGNKIKQCSCPSFAKRVIIVEKCNLCCLMPDKYRLDPSFWTYRPDFTDASYPAHCKCTPSSVAHTVACYSDWEQPETLSSQIKELTNKMNDLENKTLTALERITNMLEQKETK